MGIAYPLKSSCLEQVIPYGIYGLYLNSVLVYQQKKPSLAKPGVTMKFLEGY